VGYESGTLRRTRGLVLVLALVLAHLTAASSFAQHDLAEGVVLAVGVQQGTLLVETQEGYLLAAVDPDAAMDGPLGGTSSLGDLHSGDVVEFRAEAFAGMLIVRELHVLSGDATPRHER
jgi:hypothetical protein